MKKMLTVLNKMLKIFITIAKFIDLLIGFKKVKNFGGGCHLPLYIHTSVGVSFEYIAYDMLFFTIFNWKDNVKI